MKTIFLFAILTVTAFGSEPVFREDFASLDDWEPLTFPKIERHTIYSIQSLDGTGTVLKAEANASASGLVHKKTFSPYDSPVLRFRWRAENVLEKGDATRKDGDDYPIRVYVFFPYVADEAGLRMRAQYAIARRLFGEYPPHSGLNYIWANRKHRQRILDSPYTSRSKMIILQAGGQRLGEWITEQVNILEDYRAAFGEDPPRQARLAIMSDADNTGEKAVGYVDWIEMRSLKEEVGSEKLLHPSHITLQTSTITHQPCSSFSPNIRFPGRPRPG